MNWQMANRIAQIAAVKAHDRLGIDAARYPISTSRGIDGAGLTLCWRPLPKLFGMYIEAGGNRGVLVSNMFTRATRRHTAAHELGHHEFRHVPNPSTPCSMEEQSASARSGIGRQGETEMTAEAFAAWYLMPRRAVIAARADLGLVDPLRPQDIYQLSLRLGTTYRATCRQLFGLRMATWKQVQEWLKVQPGSLKRGAARAGGLDELGSTLDIDVWVVGGNSDQEIIVSHGDIVIGSFGHALGMHTATSTPVALASLSTTGEDRDAWRCEAAVVDGEAVTSTMELLEAETGARVTVIVEPRPFGLYTPHWPSAESAQTRASAPEGRDDDARTTQAMALSSLRGGAEGARP